MKKILSLILITLTLSTVRADDSSWKQHPIFDEEVTHVIPTPNYVYFTSKNMPSNTLHEVYSSLFRFDRKGEELIGLSKSNFLNGSSVRDVIYNPDKGYLAVLYKDYDIDLLFNDGRVVNIPYYAMTDMTSSKNVNSMSIDPANNLLYLATDFGYVAINDKKYEVAESRIYGQPLMGFCRMGDNYLALTRNELLYAPVSSPRLSLDQYETVGTVENPKALYPLNDTQCLMTTAEGAKTHVNRVTKEEDKFNITHSFEDQVFNIENYASGVYFTRLNSISAYNKNGSTDRMERPSDFGSGAAGIENSSEIWNGLKRKGLNSVKKSGEKWSVTRDWMLPNAPATYASNFYLNHPEHGFMMLDFGYILPTQGLNPFTPLQLSALKQGRWKNFGPAYTNPSRSSVITASNGMALDPNNSSYLYITSYHNGILRLNLKNPEDLLHLSYPTDGDKNKDGFVVLDYYPEKNPGYSNITAPFFDKQGNMWMYFADWDDEANPNPHYYCWLAEDRKASTSAANVKQPKHIEFDVNFPISNQAFSITLQKTGNGVLVLSAGNFDEELVMINTNGTPTEKKDDSIYKFSEFTDSDGNSIELRNIRYLWEDPSTGYVWICHLNGVCYFVPTQIASGNYQLYRVKVPRNDGTNLADYLLEGVTVNHIAADSEGRKWFSTAGGGIICTSSDGREILEEFNTSNSPLPDDGIYSIGYNSDNNSLMISTVQGYAEYSLPVSQASSTKEDIKAFPNPVRPDFSGYVTITDIPTGSFVKICDSAGNLVKDLGVMSGFEMLWDVSDANFNRVRSGVYHIMVSPSNENSSYSTVGKILVMH